MITIIKNNFVYTLLKKHSQTSSELFKSSVVGAIVFVVDFLLLYTLTEFLHIFYLVSATISFIISIFVNYFLNTQWTFKNRKMKNKYKEFIVFAFIAIGALILNIVLLWLFTDIFQVYYLFSKMIVVFLVFGWSFVLRKILLF